MEWHVVNEDSPFSDLPPAVWDYARDRRHPVYHHVQRAMFWLLATPVGCQQLEYELLRSADALRWNRAERWDFEFFEVMLQQLDSMQREATAINDARNAEWREKERIREERRAARRLAARGNR